jgi:hypothetical protein
VAAQQGLLEAGGAVGLAGDEQHPLGAEGKGAQVERLVVQHAQRQAVAPPVGAPAWCHLMCAASGAMDTEPSRTSKPQTAQRYS